MFDYQLISQAIIDGDADQTIALIKKGVALGYPPEYILEKGLIHGINVVAKNFQNKEVVIPEVLLSTRAMNAGLFVAKQYLDMSKRKVPAKIVIGTVEGDIHDIGKNLVKLMAETKGIEVIDLGVDVKTKEFIDKTRSIKPHFLMISCLLTTTLGRVKDIIEALDASNVRDNVKVIVGGAPVTRAFSEKVGADYYFKDAFEFKRFLENNLYKIVK